jgi:hypothetical protein
MLFAAVCWLGTLGTAQAQLIMQAPPLQYLGQTSAQIEKALGEEATASMTSGGTENLHLTCIYANARLIVSYNSNGVAVNVFRAGK